MNGVKGARRGQPPFWFYQLHILPTSLMLSLTRGRKSFSRLSNSRTTSSKTAFSFFLSTTFTCKHIRANSLLNKSRLRLLPQPKGGNLKRRCGDRLELNLSPVHFEHLAGSKKKPQQKSPLNVLGKRFNKLSMAILLNSNTTLTFCVGF